MLVYREPTPLTFSRRKVAFVSGLSDPTTCALSAVQRRFLEQLAAPASEKLWLNFPYLHDASQLRRAPGLWRASCQNASQFLAASCVRYRDAARRHFAELAKSAEHLILITLSCGLEIVNRGLTGALRDTRVEIIALGPVAWSRPDLPHRLVQGTRDHLSRAFFRRVDCRVAGAGHMDYMVRSDVLAWVNECVCNSTFA